MKSVLHVEGGEMVKNFEGTEYKLECRHGDNQRKSRTMSQHLFSLRIGEGERVM